MRTFYLSRLDLLALREWIDKNREKVIDGFPLDEHTRIVAAEPTKRPALFLCIEYVAHSFNTTISSIQLPRSRVDQRNRHVFFLIAYTVGYNYSEIARYLGVHPSTVRKAVELIHKNINQLPDLFLQVSVITERLRSK